MITLNQLKETTTEILNERAPLFNKDLELAHDEIVNAVIETAEHAADLEEYEPEATADLSGYDDYEEYEKDIDQIRIDEWAENVYSACEGIGTEGAGDYMPELVYTVDIIDYLSENTAAVEEAHADICPVGTLAEQITAAVYYAREEEARNHTGELMEMFTDSTALYEKLL